MSSAKWRPFSAIPYKVILMEHGVITEDETQGSVLGGDFIMYVYCIYVYIYICNVGHMTWSFGTYAAQ